MVLQWFAWVRDQVHAALKAVMPLRITIVVVAFVALAFGFTPQGQDAVRLAGETKSYFIPIIFIIAVTVLAIVTWYSSRVLLRLNPPSRWIKDWAPRLLGFLVFLTVALDCAKAIFQYGDIRAPFWLHVYAWGFPLLGVLFLYWTYRRRLRMPAEGKPSGLIEIIQSQPVTFGLIGLLLLIFFLGALFVPVNVGVLGAPTLVALSAVTWIVIGTFTVRLGQLLNIPIVTAFVVLAFAFSKCNDNHVVPLSGAGSVAKRPTIAAQFTKWSEGKSGPVFIVVTEGGGIRAGYWTAAVLAALHHQNPEFSRHLFAISSVSGGSLGATTYAALLRTSTAPQDLRLQASHVLREDAVGPLLAGMLQPDLVQRFFPWPIFRDRAYALEHAWEHGWEARNVTQKDYDERLWEWLFKPDQKVSPPLFSDGFLETFDLTANPQQPALFLNATVVETGSRSVVSNVKLESWLTGDRGRTTPSPFSVMFDAFSELGGDVKISTATHLGARFPYVSPAGTVRATAFGKHQTVPDSYSTCVDCPPRQAECEACNRDCCHLVDGGYFEVSGAVTAQEILEAIVPDLGPTRYPVVIYISAGKEPPKPYQPQQRVGEILTPFSTLFNTRDGRGVLAVAQLRKAMAKAAQSHPDARFLDFRLTQRETVLPLGWALAEQSRNVIDASVGLPCGPNWQELVTVQRLLNPNWQPMPDKEDRVAKDAFDALPQGDSQKKSKPDIPVSEPCGVTP